MPLPGISTGSLKFIFVAWFHSSAAAAGRKTMPARMMEKTTTNNFRGFIVCAPILLHYKIGMLKVAISCPRGRIGHTLTVLDYPAPIRLESASRGCFASGFALRCTDCPHHPSISQRTRNGWGTLRFNSIWTRRQCQFQTGSPLASRSAKVLFPFTTSRARKSSPSACLIFEPVSEISSPLLKSIPISSMKALGQR